MPDHYTYPGTEVLVNLPGYTNPSLWKADNLDGLRGRGADSSSAGLAWG
jgi:hypothetical protein